MEGAIQQEDHPVFCMKSQFKRSVLRVFEEIRSGYSSIFNWRVPKYFVVYLLVSFVSASQWIPIYYVSTSHLLLNVASRRKSFVGHTTGIPTLPKALLAFGANESLPWPACSLARKVDIILFWSILTDHDGTMVYFRKGSFSGGIFLSAHLTNIEYVSCWSINDASKDPSKVVKLQKKMKGKFSTHLT